MTNKIIAGPSKIGGIGGDVARLVRLPNGGCRIEWWEVGRGWVEAPPGAFTPDEFMPGPHCLPVSAATAARLGIPPADLMIEREKPKAENPPENLTASRLREAIDLGVKMAEADALLMLTRKARQVRAAEIERRRPHLIVNNTLH